MPSNAENDYPEPYEVTVGGRPKRLPDLEKALRYALDAADDTHSTVPPMVWDVGGLCVAVVIVDADGKRLHRLFPEQWVTDDDKRVWNRLEAVPGFNRQPRKKARKK